MTARAGKAKRQRLWLLSLAIGAVGVAVLLGMSAMSSQAAFFYTPGDVQAKGLQLDRAVRVGGMVKPGSLQKQADGLTIHFLVGDESAHVIKVRYTGVPPTLFREGSGVIAEGRFQPDGTFIATEILAKHDENYSTPGMENGQHKTESLDP